MTCIVGIERGGAVYLGGDRCISDDETAHVQRDPKVWAHGGNVVLGVAGTLWQLQKLRYGRLKGFRVGLPQEWLTEDLAPIVRDLGEVVLLVGIGGALYHLDGSGGFSNVGPEFAIGTGAQAAMGALDVLADKLSAETRIRRALTSSSRIRRDVSPPFDIVSVP